MEKKLEGLALAGAVLTGAVISLTSLSGCDGVYVHVYDGPRPVYLTPYRPCPPPHRIFIEPRHGPYRSMPHPGPGFPHHRHPFR